MSSLTFENNMAAVLAQPHTVGYNTIFQDAGKVCSDCNVTYTLDHAKNSLFFVHPKNRAGLGLSWHNAHRNGLRIRSVGADTSQLQNAFAFEMSADSSLRQKQIDFNMKLIARSKGLLAGPSAEERYLTLGCGHTVAFCKAAAAGCRTSERELADESGNVDLQRLYKNEVFKKMLTVGWRWVIIPAWVDEKFPKLADIGQKALNSSNSVASIVGEIETAKAIVGYMKDAHLDEGWEDMAQTAVKAMGAPCASYAHVITKFVQKFYDGPEAPMVDVLDGVAKEFACNAVLGETFWTAVTEAKWPTKETQLPLVRCALILANLTSPILEDGIAKMLVNSDVGKLCARTGVVKSVAAEKIIEQAMIIAKSVVKAQTLPQDSILGPYGRILVRIALHLADKESMGREGIKYKVTDIQRLFLSDRPTDRPIDRPTDRLTDRLTDRPTDRPTNRPTDRPTD